MSVKIAEESALQRPEAAVVIIIREYDENKDKVAVEELERRCELGKKPCLVTNSLGDPLCRIRSFPLHLMLVAEYGEGKIVGAIRGCIKTVTRGNNSIIYKPSSSRDLMDGTRPSVHDHYRDPEAPMVFMNLAYVLGLRVSPSHRRLGVGTKLVQHLEEWCKRNGADYAYMATDCHNQASLNLFTLKCDYIKFHNPSILVQPVHAHAKSLGSGIMIKRLDPQLAGSIYRRVLTRLEFLPKDLDDILKSKLNLGTFMALPKSYNLPHWDPSNATSLPPSFAILSIWNTKGMFKFQVKGVSVLKYACCAATRVFDALAPCLRLPSIPNFFKQFGVYFLYGLHMEGKGGSRLMKSLCAMAHNMARVDSECRAVVTEVGQRDPVRDAIPHWKKFSWTEDLWCIKKLERENQGTYDWIKSCSPPPARFVDPRDF